MQKVLALGWCHSFSLQAMPFHLARAKDDLSLTSITISTSFPPKARLLSTVLFFSLSPFHWATSYSVPVSSSFYHKTKCEHTNCTLFHCESCCFPLSLSLFLSQMESAMRCSGREEQSYHESLIKVHERRKKKVTKSENWTESNRRMRGRTFLMDARRSFFVRSSDAMN